MKKGFTLIELLAVIAILAIIMLIATPSVLDVIENSRINAYKNDEQMMVKATATYLGNNVDLLPEKINDTVSVDLSDLVNNEFISSLNPSCSGKILVSKTDNENYTYSPYLDCNTEYQSNYDYVLDDLILWLDGADFKNSPPTASWPDKSGLGNDATPYRMAYTTSSGSDNNGGVVFDDVDDYVSAPITNLVTDKFSIVVTIKPNNLDIINSTYGNTILATSSHYGVWVLQNNRNIRVYSFSSNTTDYRETTSNPLTINEWQTITITAIRDGDLKIYVNGNLIDTFKSSNSVSWAGVLGLGDLRLDRLLPFGGSIKNLLVYNRILSSKEIQQNYLATLKN